MKSFWFACGLATGIAGAGYVTATQKPKALEDSPALERMYRSDQADRQGAIDWVKVAPRDAERRRKTLAMYRQGGVRTGNDYVRAAMVLQHGEGDDQLLAHEMCVAALALDNAGKRERGLAVWLAAASEDRWLEHIGRKQRFATQYGSKPLPNGTQSPTTLNPVETPGVTDAHRKAMSCPTLKEAKDREKIFNQS